MAISADLLEILICPACRAKVELKPDGGGLRCVSCHRLYPIRDEIPVMLVDEAQIDETPIDKTPVDKPAGDTPPAPVTQAAAKK